MKKKIYEKPTMKVVLLQHKCQLLTGSGDERGIPGYDDDYGYMPGWGKDGGNHLT